ncbi:hypothetical protein N6L26_03755 [Qipengyuania sp. SS22]|uniref:hypothetical protein n=1 Tax=Qipengyuania sp. SS22 TaxID=2979461 RepID=UPI0021E5F5F6|nr:hypothetical protein [Qipengyuania sp. SS22]UYH55684.1 hypothetical protein N6L26_03755 [Qipengyuania sp. SS22]
MTVDAQSGEQGGGTRPGLLLMFDRGQRPDRAAVAAALATIPRAVVSHDPAQTDTAHHVADPQQRATAGEHWLELLADGLTFDLLGLSPGPALAAPEVAYRYNCEIDCLLDSEAIALFPGPHIAQGAHTLPIIRTLLGLGAALTDALEGVQTVCWPVARTAIAPRFFARTVDAWRAGGPFPALGMLGFDFDELGGLHSEGLRFFIGCELAIDPAVCRDRLAATRLAVRIVQELVGYQLPDGPQEFPAEGGEIFTLEPDLPVGLVRVRPA